MKTISLLLALTLAPLALAGNPGADMQMVTKTNGKGGGQMVGGKNADGVPVEVTLSDQHPYEAEIKDFIRGSELPAVLKAEMLYDLENTKIYYSSETITYQDLASKLVMVLDSITKRTVKDGDREVVTVEENYKRIAELSNHDIFIDTSIKYDDTSNARVSAYTRQNPREVIYFTFHTGAPGENSSDGQLKKARVTTVFHEQAHRLAHYLGKDSLFKNERFVMGWADLLTSYFLKQKPIQEVKTALIRAGLPMERLSSTPHFRDEERVVITSYSSEFGDAKKYEKQVYSATKTIQVRGNQILWHGPGEKFYELQLDNSVFAEHPQFQGQKGPWIVRIEDLSIGPRIRYLQELVDQMQQSQESYLLDVRVEFLKINEQAEFDKARRTRFEILGMRMDFSQIARSWDMLLKSHKFISKVTYVDPVLVAHPDRQAKMEAFILRLNSLLQKLAMDNPSSYEFLSQCCEYSLYLKYSENGLAWNDRRSSSRGEGSSTWTYEINLDAMSWTDEQLLKPFIDRSRSPGDGLKFQFERDVKALQKSLFNNEIELAVNYEYAEEDKLLQRRLNAVQNFFAQHIEVTKKMSCLSESLHSKLGIYIAPKMSGSEKIMPKKYPLDVAHIPPRSRRFREHSDHVDVRAEFKTDPIYVVALFIDLDLFEKQPNALAQFIVNTMTTQKILDWDYHMFKENRYRQYESARWNDLEKKFELVEEYNYLSGANEKSAPKWYSEIEKAMAACN